MTNCTQCNKEIKTIGYLVNLDKGLGEINTINTFVCFNSECPNYLLTQVGLSEVEKMENNGNILFQKKKGGMNFGGGIEGI